MKTNKTELELVSDNKLQPKDQERFELLEKVCIEGRQVFFLTGMALGEIKDKKYFASKGFKTFEDYADSIGYSKRYCNQLILDSKTVKELPPSLQTLITTERAARALSLVPPPLRKSTVEKASVGGKAVTAEGIKQSSPPPKRPQPADKPTVQSGIPPKTSALATSSPAKAMLDETGLKVPKEIQGLWNRSSEVVEVINMAKSVKSFIATAQKQEDPLFSEVDFAGDIANLAQVITDLERAKPYAVCHTCQGKMADGCLTCKGRGFVSKFFWDMCVPSEIKEMRNS